ncbi:hypothetical protein BMH32_07450 [Leucobacter sp. OLJS4]|uniref:hypothetical protein n=1 Tax=unclassified Leucobacter TaxID=2621730 RepID=UPI000C18461A|nr:MULTISPECIES: hypothetical protein [unclassified Leucobacter]PIJ48147.1 hypothetical protein BMH30_05610 [Leucobacter sp. OLES1]PII85339.1 hypothetical protein BMH25_02235 [Leucobacter sp. OLCALW19]PII93119.1 hypothetical protein BMH27_04085 [Leucobacter sp. OLAS13]PII95991.1 hypothetical protein BMH26_01360 [Leucobacter sp. OLTLW20]PII99209.1 hypothetical protein BMH29_05735 [Leucobacter sp. OLDS2]
MKTTASRIRPFALTVGAAALLLPLTGCSVIDAIGKSSQDAWQLNYEVTTDGSASATLTDVSYLDTSGRLEEAAMKRVGTVETSAGAGGAPSKWKADSIVVVGKQTRISATPPAGVRATCRILLDDSKEIATATSDPGKPVTCEAKAPEFPK